MHLFLVMKKIIVILLAIMLLIPYGSYGNQQYDGKPLSKMTILERCAYYHKLMVTSAMNDDRDNFKRLRSEFEGWLKSNVQQDDIQYALKKWATYNPSLSELLVKWNSGKKIGYLEWMYALESDAVVRKLIDFEEEQQRRERIVIQRLKDIRDLQIAYKNVNGRYVSTIDSLQRFYREGTIPISIQIGSNYDSLAIANTKRIKARFPRLKGEELNRKLYEYYLAGEALVFTKTFSVPVRDTLFRSRPDFHIDSIAFIPFSGGMPIQMVATIRKVQGVRIPLFEASIPYRLLFRGMHSDYVEQRIKCKNDAGRYPGLKVGDINFPNNNAGNWE